MSERFKKDMTIFIEITVKKWRPWMKKFNQIFSKANRKIEIVIWPIEDQHVRCDPKDNIHLCQRGKK
jgi:hypothetical protein